MVVKIFSSQYHNTGSTEYQINKFLEENPGLRVANIAVSQGLDSGARSGTYIVVIDFEGEMELEEE
jgi:hypothetical protein